MKNSSKNTGEITLSQEFFEIRLICESDEIDIFCLIKYLTQTNQMVQGINETLNKDFTAGYDEVEISALALEHGSIRIPLIIKKLALHTLFELPPAILGGVAVHLLTNSHDAILVTTPSGNVETQSDTFLNNLSTKRSVGKIAQMVVENDSISNLALTYQKDDGQKESITVTKEVLKKVAEECESSDDDEVREYSKTRLQIYGPILGNKPSSWQVKLNGQTIHAHMSDKDFLEEMTAKKIAFAPDDEIVADLEERIYRDEKGEHKKWTIKKVHSYPKYTRITKSSQKGIF